MSDIVERLLRASPRCPCGGDPVAVRKTCPQYSRCTANADAADEIERLRTRLAEAEKVVEPFAGFETRGAGYLNPENALPDDEPNDATLYVVLGDPYLDRRVVELKVGHLRAARAWKENTNAQ